MDTPFGRAEETVGGSCDEAGASTTCDASVRAASCAGCGSPAGAEGDVDGGENVSINATGCKPSALSEDATLSQ